MEKISLKALYYQARSVKFRKIPPNGFAYELFLDEKGEKFLNQKEMVLQ